MGKKRRQIQRERKYQLSQRQMMEISKYAAEEFNHGRPMRPVPVWALMNNRAYEAFAYALHDEIEKLKRAAR